MIKISNNKYTLYVENIIEVYDSNLANKLNRVLKYYPDYHFRASKLDEARFRFKEQDRPLVEKLLKRLS